MATSLLARRLPRRLRALAAAFVCVALAAAAFLSPAAARADMEIALEVGAGRVVTLPAVPGTLFVADQKVADVQAPESGNSFFVFGKAPGRTSVFALNAAGRPIASYAIRVVPPLADTQRLLVERIPEARVRLEATATGTAVIGTVPSPAVAARVMDVVSQGLGKDEKVVNQLDIAAATQVNLRVRVAEVSRTASKELGVNFENLFNVGAFTFGLATGRDAVTAAGQILRSTTGSATLPFSYKTGNVDVNAVVDALAAENLISILAEPNLTALSGETASFLAGGEFPIPIARRDDEVSIEFKQFGISLDFVPTVLSAGRISMRVRPEVSELSDEGAVILNDIRIPALTVRRAETTVELGSGQSFAIAGLIQNNTRTVVDRVPGLGDVPVLGSLFRSSRFQRNESELVIVVTPYLVRPAAGPAELAVPTDGFVPASDVERIFLGRVNTPTETPAGAPIGPGGVRLNGDAGFVLE
jgi:pilus assembly protein CpaC